MQKIRLFAHRFADNVQREKLLISVTKLEFLLFYDIFLRMICSLPIVFEMIARTACPQTQFGEMSMGLHFICWIIFGWWCIDNDTVYGAMILFMVKHGFIFHIEFCLFNDFSTVDMIAEVDSKIQYVNKNWCTKKLPLFSPSVEIYVPCHFLTDNKPTTLSGNVFIYLEGLALNWT